MINDDKRFPHFSFRVSPYYTDESFHLFSNRNVNFICKNYHATHVDQIK